MSKQYNSKEVDDLLAKSPTSQDNKIATKNLLKKFPEFKNSEFYGQTDKELPYLVFGDFNNFLLDKIKNSPDPRKDKVLKRAVNFISNLYNSDKQDLRDLAIAGVFESLASEPEAKKIIELFSPEVGQAFKNLFPNSGLINKA
jgi:hypothetical protein